MRPAVAARAGGSRVPGSAVARGDGAFGWLGERREEEGGGRANVFQCGPAWRSHLLSASRHASSNWPGQRFSVGACEEKISPTEIPSPISRLAQPSHVWSLKEKSPLAVPTVRTAQLQRLQPWRRRVGAWESGGSCGATKFSFSAA